MERRQFLALLASPAFLALLQACGDDSGSGDDTKQARSQLARLAADPAVATSGARAVNALGADLYRVLATGDANLVYSPASIMLALAMTRAGAVGETATEMDTVLHAAETGSTPDALHPAMNSLSTLLEARSGSFKVEDQTQQVELAIANSLWGQDGITWVPAFLDLLATQYGAGMRLVDYAKDAEAARTAINEWVADETKDRIPELLVRGTITPDARLTLVNAIYLKAPWLEPFPAAATKDGTFTTAAGAAVTVPMMHATASMAYARGDGWQAVEVPYVGNSLTMLLLVPDAGQLAAVETALAGGALEDVTAALATHNVTLGLPRFDTETKADLTKMMSDLGMPTAFDPSRADFSGMTAQVELFIGLIVHQANITVDEKGTEAAAATAVVMGETSAPNEPVAVTIDRPFLFVVRDAPTGAALFMGRITDPR